MKKTAFIFILLFYIVSASAQSTIPETNKLATLCKVWGFLKYYHPEVAKGKRDWDTELITKIPLIKSANSKEEINEIYRQWIKSLGKVKKCKRNNNIPDSLKYNLNLNWLNDTSIFNDELISELNFIKENRSKRHYYVHAFSTSPNFKKEKPYKDSIFPGEGCRLLSLYRYWNIINYFYPYKYEIGQDWNNVLTEMIPEFQFPKDTTVYHLAMLKLTTKINDSHAWFYTKYTAKYFGVKRPPVIYKIIDNKAIVTGFYNDTLAKENDIQYGDVILKCNGQELYDLIQDKLKYTGASNEPTKFRNLAYSLFNSNSDSLKISFERNGKQSDKVIKLYKFSEFHYNWNLNKDAVCKELDDSIGYVNMGVLKRKQVDSVMKIMLNKKAIIFDVRNYPNGTMFAISKYLNKEVKPFVKFTVADFKYPGVIKWEGIYYCGAKKKIFSWVPTYKRNAKNNSNYYKGKVVLLFNEETQSHAEFSCMALQTAPDVKCIGSQTAGADGNVSLITFPGGYQTYMTGLGVYYPDGRETQRIGIVPDIEVKPTIEGVKNKKDEVLDRAIEYIKTGK